MPKNFIYEKAKASRNLYHQLKTALDLRLHVLRAMLQSRYKYF